MPTSEILPVDVGDVVYDAISTAIAHCQSAQWFRVQGDAEAVTRWLDEARLDLEAASAAVQTGMVRELRRPVEVTEQLEQVEP